MSTKKRLVEGDIFYIERNEKFIFGRILLDVNTRILKKEPEHRYKFFSGCYMAEVYKGIYDTPELTTREVIIPGQFTSKSTFYSKNKYKIQWVFYKHEPIDYTKLDFPETIRGWKKGAVLEKFDLELPTKIASFEEREEKFGKRFTGSIYPSYRTLVNNAFHFQGRDDLMSIKIVVFMDGDDLRLAPKERADIYKQINEPYNISYYDLALKHGYDIARFYE